MRRALTLTALIAASSFANDARINALGGSDMFRDPSDIYSNPAFITEHQVIEGNISSFNGDETVSSGLGTWHIGEKIVIGGYYATDDNVSPLFDEGTFAVLPRKNAPHLLFAIRFSENFSLGADAHIEASIDESKTGDAVVTQRNIIAAGALGANFTAGIVDVELSGAGSLPTSKATNTKGSTDGGDTTTFNTMGLTIEGSAIATINFEDDFRLRTGASLGWLQHKDKKADNNGPKNTDLGFQIGVAKDFEFGMTLGMETFLSYEIEDHTADENVSKTGSALFVAAAEKVFEETKLFDTHSFRIGYSHEFVGEKETIDNGGDNDNTENDYTGTWTGDDGSADLGLTLGAGFTRGKFGFDMYFSNIDLDFSDNNAGILDIIPVAGASFTIDFAKDGSVVRED